MGRVLGFGPAYASLGATGERESPPALKGRRRRHWAVSMAWEPHVLDRAFESHGGFDVVMEKIDQSEQENPASDGRRMIDDYRLQG